MAQWIGGSVLSRGKCYIQGYVQSNDAAALAQYVDILRQAYRDATDAQERSQFAAVGKLAQAALVNLTGAAQAKVGWQDRAAALYAEAR
jgi:hypothetical protein